MNLLWGWIEAGLRRGQIHSANRPILARVRQKVSVPEVSPLGLPFLWGPLKKPLFTMPPSSSGVRTLGGQKYTINSCSLTSLTLESRVNMVPSQLKWVSPVSLRLLLFALLNHDLSHHLYLPSFLLQIRAALSGGKAWEGKASCRRKTGDTVRLDTKIIPLVNDIRVGANGGKGERCG